MLSFDQHFHFHLRNIGKIGPMLSAADAETLIHVLISSRLDNCNTQFSGLPNSTTESLPVQNAAAKLQPENSITLLITQ